MKKIVLFILMSLNLYSFSQEKCFKPFKVYQSSFRLNHNQKGFIKVKGNPKGNTILKISNKMNSMFSVIDFKNGWFKINEIIGFNDFFVLSIEGWIHHSGVRIRAKGDGAKRSIDLLDKPNGNIKVKLQLPNPDFKIVNAKCEWVEIETEKGVKGWLKSDELCGHPVTVCSP